MICPFLSAFHPRKVEVKLHGAEGCGEIWPHPPAPPPLPLLPPAAESQKGGFHRGEAGFAAVPTVELPLGALGEPRGEGGRPWGRHISLPARVGQLINAPSAHGGFPILPLLTAHTSNSWDAPRQLLIALVCRASPHSSRVRNKLPPTALSTPPLGFLGP